MEQLVWGDEDEGEVRKKHLVFGKDSVVLEELELSLTFPGPQVSSYFSLNADCPV
jgi:hypothetical protein